MWLVLLALPAQGMAAAGVLCCLPVMGMTTATLHGGHHHGAGPAIAMARLHQLKCNMQ